MIPFDMYTVCVWMWYYLLDQKEIHLHLKIFELLGLSHQMNLQFKSPEQLSNYIFDFNKNHITKKFCSQVWKYEK